MPTLDTTIGAAHLASPDVGTLLVQPALEQSVAAQVTRIVTTTSHRFRIPIVAEDPSASWTLEGEEIAESSAVLAEHVVTPAKVAGLVIITRELADDTSPEAAETVGAGLARDIARQMDAALFGTMPAPAPAGLGSLPTTGPGAVATIDAGTGFTNLDPFAAALAAAENSAAQLTAWVTSPDVALGLAQIKAGTGSNLPLLVDPRLNSDQSQRATRSLLGLPLHVSPAVAPGTVWGIPGDRVLTVVRDDAEVTADRSVFFTSDRVAVRATMRVAYGYPHPAAIVKITTS